MDQHKKARLLLTASMAVFGTLGLFTRNISVNSGELALYRAVLAAALIGIFLTVKKQPIHFREFRKEIPLLLLSGIAMGINWILLFQAYRYTTISVATLSYYFAPVLVTAACPVLFREKLTGKQLLCFFMSTVGLVLIIGTGDAGSSSGELTGILFGLGAACFYAAVILLNKCIRQVAGIHRTFLQLIAAAAVLFPYVALTRGSSLSRMDLTGWACLLIVGLLHTGVTYCMYFTALRDLSGQETALLSYIDPLVAAAVSVFLLGEPITFWQITGGAMILGFTLINELGANG